MASLESELHLLLARHRDHALHPVLAAALATFECSGTPPPADAAREMALLAHAKALDESIQKLQSQRADTMAGLAVFEKRRADERAAEEEVARQAAAEVARQAAVAEGQRVEALRQAEAQQENERRRQRGNQTSFWLQENDHVDTIWCRQTTSCVALGSAGDSDSSCVEAV